MTNREIQLIEALLDVKPDRRLYLDHDSQVNAEVAIHEMVNELNKDTSSDCK